ncbi:MAG: hypothetical protein ACKOCM_12315 [Cyanobacteriota bacterium]
MPSNSPAIDTLQRLVDQVQTLSTVAETLTLRLLELEERIENHERSIEASRSRGLGPEAEERLAETEERLLGLEQMLATPDNSSPSGVAAASDDDGGWTPEE